MHIQDIKRQILAVIQVNLTLLHYKVFIFGSRVNGQGSERSDIDIGIEADDKIPSNIMEDIKAELEKIPTLKKFDVVDFKDVNDDFREVALKKIELLYER